MYDSPDLPSNAIAGIVFREGFNPDRLGGGSRVGGSGRLAGLPDLNAAVVRYGACTYMYIPM